jgi:hypothetical protein
MQKFIVYKQCDNVAAKYTLDLQMAFYFDERLVNVKCDSVDEFRDALLLCCRLH